MGQPFTVGRLYESQLRRVVLVGINPGAGSRASYKQERLAVLQRFRAGDDSALLEYALAAERDVPLWANQRFLNRVEGLGLGLSQVAFGNLALCATAGNKYPGTMLTRCFERHSSLAIAALRPHVVVLMGSAATAFVVGARTAAPDATVVPMLHFAHREGHDAEAATCATVRALLNS